MATLRGYLGRHGPDIGLLTGKPGALELLPGPAAVNPNFLTLSNDGTVLYAAVRDDRGNEVGAWAVEDDWLRPLGAQPSGGEGLCHLTVDASGTHVVSTHYGSGSVAVHPIAADGSLEERSDLVQHAGDGPHERQAGPHAHQVINDPTGEFLLVVDLGADTVFRYRLSAGRLQTIDAVGLPPGAGPRHLALNPSGPFAYVANELDSTVSVLDLEAFEIVSTVRTVPEGLGGHDSQPSAVRVSADGRFCYVANLDFRSGSCVEVRGRGQRGGKVKRSRRLSHQGMGVSRVG